MATTPNYGWVMPDPTDFVTNLPADFEVFGDAVDASFAANEGDLLVGGTSNIFEPLPIGAAGEVLTSDGTTAAWAAAAGGGLNWSLLNTGGTALTGSGTITVSGITKPNVFIFFVNASTSATFTDIRMRFNSDTTSKYSAAGSTLYFPNTYTSNIGQSTNRDINGSSSIPCGYTGNNASSIGSGYFLITGADQSTPKIYHGVSAFDRGGTSEQEQMFIGGVFTGSAISSVSLIAGSGNFDAGTIYIYEA